MVSISKKHKFVYIAAYKTASISVTDCLREFTDEPNYKHHARVIEVRQYLEGKGFDLNDFYSFSTIRNPWQRLVSAWNHVQENKREDQYWIEYIAGMRQQLSDMKEQMNLISDENIKNKFQEQIEVYKREIKKVDDPDDKKAGFNEWIKGQDRDFFLDYQFDYMYCDENGKCLINKFIKIEEINHEFPKLMDKLGLENWTLPTLNVKPHEYYKQYYNDESIDIVAKTYKKEIELFDYGFNYG